MPNFQLYVFFYTDIIKKKHFGLLIKASKLKIISLMATNTVKGFSPSDIDYILSMYDKKVLRGAANSFIKLIPEIVLKQKDF